MTHEEKTRRSPMCGKCGSAFTFDRADGRLKCKTCERKKVKR